MATPLYYATQEKQIDAMRLLIDHGADVNKHERYMGTPLFIAIPNKEAVILLINNGADVNITHHSGQTLLRLASWLRVDKDIIQLLKDNGAHM